MDWPGNSRSKFAAKLEKTLKFKCIDDRNACNQGLAGRVFPVLHHRRIAICSNTIADLASDTSGAPFNANQKAWYALVVAHEVGHHVRWNVHRTNCRKLYRTPRFSTSVGLAAFHGYLGTPYSSGDWMRLASCP